MRKAPPPKAAPATVTVSIEHPSLHGLDGAAAFQMYLDGICPHPAPANPPVIETGSETHSSTLQNPVSSLTQSSTLRNPVSLLSAVNSPYEEDLFERLLARGKSEGLKQCLIRATQLLGGSVIYLEKLKLPLPSTEMPTSYHALLKALQDESWRKQWGIRMTGDDYGAPTLPTSASLLSQSSTPLKLISSTTIAQSSQMSQSSTMMPDDRGWLHAGVVKKMD